MYVVKCKSNEDFEVFFFFLSFKIKEELKKKDTPKGWFKGIWCKLRISYMLCKCNYCVFFSIWFSCMYVPHDALDGK